MKYCLVIHHASEDADALKSYLSTYASDLWPEANGNVEHIWPDVLMFDQACRLATMFTNLVLEHPGAEHIGEFSVRHDGIETNFFIMELCTPKFCCRGD